MVNNKTITLIIPCKNEAKALSSLLPKIPSYIDEILIIDNGSTDETIQVAKKYNAVVIRENRHDAYGIGYGYAHQKGVEKATSDYIVAMDGDDTYPLRSIKNIIKHMEKKSVDFVSCNRLPLKNSKAISPIRRLGIHILNIEIALLFGYPMQDTLTGMWIGKRISIKCLDIKSGGWDYSPEIKLAAIFDPEIKFMEYHIQHFYRDKGNSKLKIWQTGYNHFKFIFKRRIELSPALNFLYRYLILRVGITIKAISMYLFALILAVISSRYK